MNTKYKESGYVFIMAFFAICFAASCSNNKFKVKGEITGGARKMLFLEKADFQGYWQPVDSVKTNGNGGYSITFPTPASPEIFRLSLNNQYVYFPIDGSETLTINTSYENFGHDFSLDGTAEAKRLADFEKDLQNTDTSNPDSLISFKKRVFANYMKDFRGSIVSFYILTKTVDNKTLYNPNDSIDRKYFAAVATGFKDSRPDDPHTALLENIALEAMKQKNIAAGKLTTLEAPEIALIDMELLNEKGQYVKLSDVAGKGKPVVVVFSVLNHPDSPDFNRQLAQEYSRHSGNVEFYNVSLDDDMFAWREAAANLPWITVFSQGGLRSEDALKYNVTVLPTFFIYNGNGELTSSTVSLDQVRKKL